MPQFLIAPEAFDPAARSALLTGGEARHLARVLRARPGDAVLLFDGEGRRWEGVVTAIDADSVRVEELSDLPSGEGEAELWLLAALIKGERWEWLLEKATELGATRILPLLTEHGVARPGAERAAAKAERWGKCLLAAAKQCERARVPTVDEPRAVAALLAALPSAGEGEARYLLAARSDAPPPLPPAGSRRILLAVGPEGGFTPEEEEAFAAGAFVPASLAPRILRSETAALAALALARN